MWVRNPRVPKVTQDAIMVTAWVTSSQGLTGWSSASRLSHVAIDELQILSVDQSISSSPKGQLSFPRENIQEGQSLIQKTQWFYNLISKVTSHHFSHILVIRSHQVHTSGRGKSYPRSWIAGGAEHSGPFWRCYHSSRFLHAPHFREADTPGNINLHSTPCIEALARWPWWHLREGLGTAQHWKM